MPGHVLVEEVLRRRDGWVAIGLLAAVAMTAWAYTLSGAGIPGHDGSMTGMSAAEHAIMVRNTTDGVVRTPA